MEKRFKSFPFDGKQILQRMATRELAFDFNNDFLDFDDDNFNDDVLRRIAQMERLQHPVLTAPRVPTTGWS